MNRGRLTPRHVPAIICPIDFRVAVKMGGAAATPKSGGVMKNILRATIVVVTVGATALLGTVSASAAGCDLGYTCQWQGEQYTGSSWGNSIVAQNWGLGQYDTASAVHAHGRDCKATTYYKGPDFTDINFTINSQKVGGNFKDPYLKNGAGTQPGVDFDNNLSSYSFINCA